MILTKRVDNVLFDWTPVEEPGSMLAWAKLSPLSEADDVTRILSVDVADNGELSFSLKTGKSRVEPIQVCSPDYTQALKQAMDAAVASINREANSEMSARHAHDRRVEGLVAALKGLGATVAP